MSHPNSRFGTDFVIKTSDFFVYLFVAVASDSQEDVRPPDSKKFQTEMDEILERIREFEAKLVSHFAKRFANNLLL